MRPSRSVWRGATPTTCCCATAPEPPEKIMSDDIARRLERLERIEAAKVATARYGRVIDAKDLDGLAEEVFTPDATLHVPRADYHGTSAIVGFYRDAFEASPGTRRHFLTNYIAEAIGENEVDVT